MDIIDGRAIFMAKRILERDLGRRFSLRHHEPLVLEIQAGLDPLLGDPGPQPLEPERVPDPEADMCLVLDDDQWQAK